eukprot:TRINITY_DN3639_c0_g1_i2.p1 TRINITY_DN3639_c0_g1~~TRINITY_DN3639_c0_g1_i2.p1  ORF type:complete len:139 (-),score=19.52 TRINITY_DN3639_c0_g1_i2:116-532(-)
MYTSTFWLLHLPEVHAHERARLPRKPPISPSKERKPSLVVFVNPSGVTTQEQRQETQRSPPRAWRSSDAALALGGSGALERLRDVVAAQAARQLQRRVAVVQRGLRAAVGARRQQHRHDVHAALLGGVPAQGQRRGSG